MARPKPPLYLIPSSVPLYLNRDSQGRGGFAQIWQEGKDIIPSNIGIQLVPRFGEGTESQKA